MIEREWPAIDEQSSTFGWGARPTDPRQIVEFRDEQLRADTAPIFTIAGTCEVSEAVGAGVARQQLQDVRVIREPCSEDLAPFRVTCGRYAILVTDTVGFAAVLAADRMLLMRLAVVALRYHPAALSLRLGEAEVAILLDRTILLGREDIPRSADGLRADALRYMATIGRIGVYDLADSRASPQQIDRPPRSPSAAGWRAGPLRRPTNAVERDTVEALLHAYPSFLATSVRRGLWTCLSNDWYGHRDILRTYAGLHADIQIDGKLQHGWQSGCGIDGERGYKLEARRQHSPIYLWNRRNAVAAQADGIDWATPIGAPFLYRKTLPDPGPAARTLLCFPYHSVPEYPIAADWTRFADRLLTTAKLHDFASVTVCLHHFDAGNEATRRSLRATGVEVTTLGPAMSLYFLDRLDVLIRAHAAVTSDRICTAGLYAEVLGRPFFVSGEALRSSPPDPDEGLGANRMWIAEKMPEFLTYSGATHRGTTLRELGHEFVRDPDDLLRLLWRSFSDA